MLYLASTSPRRRALLTTHSLDYVCIEPGEEPRSSGEPRYCAHERARAKAEGAVISGLSAGLVLGVDTVVALDGEEFGKPVDRVDAARMLMRLSAREHSVHTALHLWQYRPGLAPSHAQAWSTVQTARVRCCEIDRARLEDYLDRAEWSDKAGGYGIQAEAAAFMSLVDGDLETVIGLPVAALISLMRAAGGAA